MHALFRSVRVAGAALIIMLPLLGAADGAPPGTGNFDTADGELLAKVDHQNRVFEGFLRAEVGHALHQARDDMGVHPAQAEETLTLLLDKVRRIGEIQPELRAQLVDQIEAAQHLAHRQAERQHQARLTGAERKNLDGGDRQLALQERDVARCLSRYRTLMAEGRYRDAETVASMAQEIGPGRAVSRNAELTARLTGYTADQNTVREMRHAGYVDTMLQVELSSIPTPDGPPVLYPDPEAWQSLTQHRKRYAAADLDERSPNELKILVALDEKTEIDFGEQPLNDVIDYLKQRHNIEIQLDNRALANAGVDGAATITRSVKGITLRSALNLLLDDLDLTFVIRHEVLLITSKTAADNMREARVYPVGDLVSRNPFVRRAARRVIGRISGGTIGGGAF